ncbi:MerR family transcriptional regulator [Litorimonas sp. RW-G-Af-16]|uniref:MerR family transcriptional regulator n=1 Tax=Litorimonas sp. RW-G-Af-16 TaxID=3241168 RepID=UPI003AAAB03A
MQTKTTRAFRTISEAGEELGLQPHVLRFWESKFPQIKPIKRGGGRRFYRPEDIEFLRGIKKLLHDENHPIKDVQKLIRVKGANRIVELGRSVEKASRDRDLVDTVLIPERIQKAEKKPSIFSAPQPKPAPQIAPSAVAPTAEPEYVTHASAAAPEPTGLSSNDRQKLEDALQSLTGLRARWQDFKTKAASE